MISSPELLLLCLGSPVSSVAHVMTASSLFSQVRCLSCGHDSNTYETFTSLSLDIVRGTSQSTSLQDSLGMFTAPERLDGANK